MDSLDTFATHPELRAIIDRGAREGSVSYQFINEALGDLPVDDDATEALFEVLEKRGIQVVDEPASAPPAPPVAASLAPAGSTGPRSFQPEAASPAFATPEVTPPSAHPAPRAKAKKPGGHHDLDEVLASLQELMNSPFGELLAGDDAATEGAPLDEESPGTPVEDSFTQYMNRMGRVPLLTEDEERRLARLVQSGGPAEREAARAQLVDANLRLVVALAKPHANHAALPLIDIVQEGNLGLIRAVNKWNPERGGRFSSYATWYIRDSINHAIQAQARSIRLPGHLSAAIQKLQRLQRELTQKLGRTPHLDELAEAASMTAEQVTEIFRLSAEPLSFETPLGEDENSTLGEYIADPGDDEAMAEISRREVHTVVESALETLSDLERGVLSQRYGLGDYASNGSRTVDDVAKSMRLSRERVRELELRALRKMRRRTRGTVLEGLFGPPADEDF